MVEKMLAFRVDSETTDHLAEVAKRLNLSKSDVARMMLRDGLAMYDRKFDVLTEEIEKMQKTLDGVLNERIDKMQKTLDFVLALSAGSVAGSVQPTVDPLEATRNVQNNFGKQALDLLRWGNLLHAAIESGDLEMKTLRVSLKPQPEPDPRESLAD